MWRKLVLCLFWIGKNLALLDSVVWESGAEKTGALFVLDREESYFARFCCLGQFGTFCLFCG
jgi:hypothetical protein